MPAPTFTIRGIVLRKTKLGESDLVITFLAEDGSQVRAVAKGARKPRSSFAARLELYSIVEVLCAKGRSLDIVKEVRLLSSNERVRCDMEHAAAAAPIVELLERVTQVGLEHPRLFALTEAALNRLCHCEPLQTPNVTAACLLKILALCGFRPSLRSCVSCGASALDGLERWERTPFSFTEGGVSCSDCRSEMDTVMLSVSVIRWMDFMTMSTFDDLLKAECDASASFAVLEVCHQWIRTHAGMSLKSLNFMFTCGLYSL